MAIPIMAPMGSPPLFGLGIVVGVLLPEDSGNAGGEPPVMLEEVVLADKLVGRYLRITTPSVHRSGEERRGEDGTYAK